MPYLSLENMQRGFSQIDPEQTILINAFYVAFDSRNGANRQIVNVEPITYIGAIAGSEFEDYAATKMYLCFGLNGSMTIHDHPTPANIQTYNEANVLSGQHGNNAYVHLPAGVDEYTAIDINIKNLWFSRLVLEIYEYIIFNGYRITLI